MILRLILLPMLLAVLSCTVSHSSTSMQEYEATSLKTSDCRQTKGTTDPGSWVAIDTSVSPDGTFAALATRSRLESVSAVPMLSTEHPRLDFVEIDLVRREYVETSWYDSIEFVRLNNEDSSSRQSIDGAVVPIPCNLEVGYPTWAPNGEFLAFLGRSNGIHSLWVVDVNTSPVPKLLSTRVNALLYGEKVTGLTSDGTNKLFQVPFVWAPDSKSLFFLEKGVESSRPFINSTVAAIPRVRDTRAKGRQVTGEIGLIGADGLSRERADELRALFYGKLVEKQLFSPEGQINELYTGYVDAVWVDAEAIVVSIVGQGGDTQQPPKLLMRMIGDNSVLDRDSMQFSVPESTELTHIAVSDDKALYYSIGDDGGACVFRYSWVRSSKEELECRPYEVDSVYSIANWVFVEWSWNRYSAYNHVEQVNTVFEFTPDAFLQHASRILPTKPGQYDGDQAYFVSIKRNEEGHDLEVIARNLSKGVNRSIYSRSVAVGEESYSAFVLPNEQILVWTSESERNRAELVVKSPGRLSDTNLYSFSPERRSDLNMRTTWLEYERKDGVRLTAQLVTPDEEQEKKYPVVLWQYPILFESRDEVDRNQGAEANPVLARVSPSRRVFKDYSYVGDWLSEHFIRSGYAVLYFPDFPLIGPYDGGYIATYLEQTVWNAEAALSALSSLSTVDLCRVAIAGQSRGGGDAVSLLAETELFSTAISVAGATSLTHKPQRIQYHDIPYWEDSGPYLRASPILKANEINKPVLLFHGREDRTVHPFVGYSTYVAIREHGGTSRFIELPFEGHGPRLREFRDVIKSESIRWIEENFVNRFTASPFCQ